MSFETPPSPRPSPPGSPGGEGAERHRSLLTLLALWTLGVGWPLLETLAAGPQFLVVHRVLGMPVAALAFCVVLLPPLLMWLVELLAGRISDRAALFLHRLWVLGLSACLALLVARQLGLDGVAWIVVGVVPALAALVAYVRLRPVRSFVRMLGVAAVLTPFLFLFSPDVRSLFLGELAPPNAPSAEIFPVASTATAPIVWLVADEWALSTILAPDHSLDREQFPNLAALADDATWYRGATSVSGATELAVPALFGGRLPEPKELPVRAHWPTQLFSLMPDYAIWAQETVSFFVPPEGNLADELVDEAAPSNRLFGLLSDLRWLYFHRLVPDGWRHVLPPVSDRWSGFGGPASQDRQAILERFLPTFEKRLHADRMAELDRFLAALGPDDRRLYFLHLLLPHTPYRYLPDGRPYRLTTEHVPGLLGERWGPSQARVDQARLRYQLQVRALDTLVGRLVARMKKVGVYERATLVLVSDHGISFRAGELRRTATADNAHELLPVPLFVKAPGQTEGRVVDEPFSLVDLLPMVLDTVDQAYTSRPRASATWEQGWVPLVNVGGLEWIPVDAVQAEPVPPPPQPFPALIGRTVDEIGWTESTGPAVALDERLLPLGSAGPGQPVSALVRGQLLDSNGIESCDLAVALGGRIVTTLRVEANLEPLFSSVVWPPPEAPVRPEIYRIVTADGSVVLERLPVREAKVPDTEQGARGR